MTVTLSLVLIFGVLVALAIRFKALGVGMFVLAALFGFYLADTGAADTVNQLTTAVTGVLANIGK